MAGNGLQNPDLSFTQLYGQAKVAVPLLLSVGENTLAALKRKHRSTFSTVSFEMGDLKSEERSQDKIGGDYSGDLTQITDITRGRYVVHTPAQIKALSEYFAENAESLGVEKRKNRFEVPSDTHFRDINMSVRMKNGHVVELRIEHAEMVRAAKHTHKPYAEVQMLERRAEIEKRDLTHAEARRRSELMDMIRDIHDIPAAHLDLNALLSEKGKEKLEQHALERNVRESLNNTLTRIVQPEGISAKFGQHVGLLERLSGSSSIILPGATPAAKLASAFHPERPILHALAIPDSVTPRPFAPSVLLLSRTGPDQKLP